MQVLKDVGYIEPLSSFLKIGDFETQAEKLLNL